MNIKKTMVRKSFRLYIIFLFWLARIEWMSTLIHIVRAKTKYLLIFSIFLFPLYSHAATFYFDPQEKVVGTAQPFVVALDFSADRSVNTISVSLAFPRAVTPVSIDNGNSIINDWIEDPTFDPLTRTLTFSGIIPGGFVGTGGRLITLTMKASQAGQTTLQVSSNTSEVLLNTGNGMRDSLETIPLVLTASDAKDNLDTSLPDSTPPESFTPILFRDPTLVNNQWVVLFNTQDKDSGVNHYAVQETTAHNPDKNKWNSATSPYILSDQTLSSTIFVEAVDEKGNEQMSEIKAPYPSPWYYSLSYWFILIILIFFVLYFLYAKKYHIK